jgi:hypothetical protein
MEGPADTRLQSMARALQQHIEIANDLQLNVTAQLLAMAMMEVTTKIHGISHQELEALCEHIEGKACPQHRPSMASAFGLRPFDRRSLTRRSRM